MKNLEILERVPRNILNVLYWITQRLNIRFIVAKEFTHLDFENYIRVGHGYLMLPYPDEKLKTLPDIYDRLCGVLELAWKITENKNSRSIRKDAFSETMLRATLAEFFSLGEYLKEFYSVHGNNFWFNEHVDTDPMTCPHD